MTLNCIVCKSPFDTKRKDACFCSTRCRVQYHRSKDTKPIDNQIDKDNLEHWAIQTIEKAVKEQGYENTKAFFDRQFQRFILLGK